MQKKVFIFLFLSTFCRGIEHELIENYKIQKNRLDVKINKNLREKYFRQNFFAEYKDVNLEQIPPSIALIPFVSSVITVVWASKMDFYIDELDQDFAYGLEKIKKVLQKMYPSLSWAGNLIARKLVKNNLGKKENNNKIAVTFSAGVDTTCTSLRHIDKQQLLITVWGSDASPFDYHMWKGIKSICKNFAQTFGHEFTYLRSNFTGLFNINLYHLTPEITSWWKYTSMGISYCGLVAPILAANGYSQLYVGSTYTQDYTLPSGTLPELDENARYGGITVIHDSYDLNRQEKVALIATVSKQLNKKIFLRPCWKQDSAGKNCQNCFGKCLQTMIALLIEGYNPREFGFTLTDDEIIQKTQHHLLFSEIPPMLSIGSVDRWKTMQKRILVNLENETIQNCGSPAIKDFLKWLTTIPMEKYKF